MKRAAIIIGKIFLGILSFILCVLLFVSTLATMLVADVKVATNKDNLANLIKNSLSAPVHTQLGPVSAAAGGGLDLSSGDLSGSIIEFAYDTLAQESGGELPISLEQAKQFVEDSTIKDFIADKSASIISDIYTGQNTTTFTSDEIKTLLTENKGVIKQYFDVELTEEQIGTVAAMIDEIPAVQQMQQQGIASLITGGTTPDLDQGATDANGEPLPSQPPASSSPLNDVLETVRAVTATPVLLGCIGLCLFLLGLLFLCAWSKPYKALIVGGIPILLAGLIFLVPTMIASFATATWLELMSFAEMVGPISIFILKLTASVCISVSVLGIAMIAGGIVLGCFMRKRRAARSAALEAPSLEEAPAAEDAPAAEEASAMEEVTAAEEPVAEEVPAE